MTNKKKRKFYWRKLDDQAKIYSLSVNRNDTSIFRLSVILKDLVDASLLQQAVELSLEKYTAFKVKMQGGFFWYYLDHNEKKPVVTEENDFPFQKINTYENNDYLFKVTYFEKKINIEFFHTLTDGNGGSRFFKEIICNYLELKYPQKIKPSLIENIEESLTIENSYLKNYEKKSKKAYNPPKAYMLKGKTLRNGIVSINHFNIKLEELKILAKKEKCSLSVLLVSMLIYSIYEANYKKYFGKGPINVCIPIDLKKYFSSETISNFVSYMVVNTNFKHYHKYTFPDVLSQVNNEFEKKLKQDKIVETMSSNGKMINNIIVRLVPLALKRIMVVLGTLEFKRHFTTTFSNIGIFEIDEKYHDYIDDYYFILSPDWSEKLRCGVVSFKGNLIITFGTNLKKNNIEKHFKELLDEFNLTYTIMDNGIN